MNATAGLVDSMYASRTETDHFIPTETLFTEVATLCIELDKSLDVPYEAFTSTKLQLPSWVPDRTMEPAGDTSFSGDTTIGNASGDVSSRVDFRHLQHHVAKSFGPRHVQE